MESTIRNLLKISLFLLLGFHASAQAWKPAMEGIHPTQDFDYVTGFSIKFKHNLNGKDWIYGSYWDEDSIKRIAGYREGGKWVPLPISFYYGSYATDMEMYGDTLYISGSFGDIKLDIDTSKVFPVTGMLKWYKDSLWTAPLAVSGVIDMAVSGDTLLCWGGSYYNPPNIIYEIFMTTDGGVTWQYPYSVKYPIATNQNFGGYPRLEIVNGEIITIDNGSPPGYLFRGISRWDGQQWNSYGQGLLGNWASTYDFDFYNGELYMGGSFSQALYPQNPGNCIARWDGQQWHNLANGLDRQVIDLFPHDSLLYCHSDGVLFGDAYIPHLAAWDGSRWCGTPTGYFSQEPTSYGFANDTLFASFYTPTSLNGDTLPYLIYFDGNYAKGDSSICSSWGLDVKENTLQNSPIKLYPNPASQSVKILSEKEAIQSIVVYDLQGRELLSKNYSDNQKLIELNISEFNNGLYIIEINGKYNQKFIKN